MLRRRSRWETIVGYVEGKHYHASPFTLTPLTGSTSYQVQIPNIDLEGMKRLKPVEFSRVTNEIRARFAHDALALAGPVHSITIDLSDELLATAYRKRNFADWIGRRIKRALNIAFGRVVNLYLVLEELCVDKRTGRETIRPHFHGEIAISADEAELARKVIRKAVGEWRSVAGSFR